MEMSTIDTQVIESEPSMEQPKPAAPERSRPKGAAAVVAILALLFASLALVFILGAALVIGLRVSESVTTNGLSERVVLPEVAGAPDVDLVLPVESVMRSGVEQEIMDTGRATNDGRVISSESAIHIATVSTETGSVDLYRWTEATPDATAPEFFCSGSEFKNTSGSSIGWNAGCGGIANETSLSWGQTTSSNGDSVYNVSVQNLPQNAAWFVVESGSGYQVASAIVDGTGYVDWVAASGPITGPETAMALDANFNQIWSSPIGE